MSFRAASAGTKPEKGGGNVGVFEQTVCYITKILDAHASLISALATVIIAAFTITLWITSSRQVRLMKETLIADKRAFVCADSLLYVWVPPNPNDAFGLYSWRLRPKWRNTGGTPTKRLKSYVECEVRNSLLPAGYSFAPQSEIVGRGIIPPQAEWFGGEAPAGGITVQDILDAQAFKKFIYLWGWVKYFDVFPGTPEHVTHFCWLITVIGDPTTFIPNTLGQPPTPGTLNFVNFQHTEGNYADENPSSDVPASPKSDKASA